MISDVLFDAITEIDRYMADPVFPYKDGDSEVKAQIVRVRNEMDALRARLDNADPAPMDEGS